MPPRLLPPERGRLGGGRFQPARQRRWNAIARERPITIAILAIGGQGGGVLTDWLIALAEQNGWYVQATSVAGVAQRTGATIYYLEMIPAVPGGRRCCR